MARLRGGTSATAAPYLPALDGLRAVAVFAVIAYHLNLSWASGGYLGVDLFFVLSGYLITGILVGEWGRSGGIGFRSFWARRARRLLPALVLLLLALAVYASLGGPGLDRSALRSDSLYTLFYSANWHQIFAGQSYFSQFQAPSPLRHTWSLAIEEQFYLVWPLLLMGVLVVFRGSRRIGLLVTALLAAGSAALMAVLYHPGVDPSRVYYGTDTRAFELLVGAALAMVMAGRPPVQRRYRRVLLHAAGLASMGALVYAGFAAAGPPAWMYRGGLLAGCVLASLVIASVSQPRSGPLGAVLSIPPVRWIGRISYGLYLWHWAVIVLATSTTTGLSGWPLIGLQVGLTLALATTSYYLVERPVRQARFSGWKGRVVAPAGVGVTVCALVFATVPAAPSIAAAAAPLSTSVTASAAGGASGAGVTPIPPGPPSKVLVVGDSTAETLEPGLADMQGHYGLDVHDDASLGCTIVTGYTEDDSIGMDQQATLQPQCDWRKRFPAYLDSVQPQVVLVLFGPWDTSDYLIDGHWLRVGTPAWQSYYQDQVTQMASLLSSQGARVVLSTAPDYHFTPTATIPHPTFDDPSRVAALDTVYRSVAASDPSVHLYDLAPQVGADDLSDGVHFTRAGADKLALSLDPALEKVANPVISLPPGRALTAADPLRVMTIGDGLMSDAAPGVVAALEATRVVKVSDASSPGWGLSPGRRTELAADVRQKRPEVVLGTWSSDDAMAQSDPTAYAAALNQALGSLLAPGDGVDGVMLLESPPVGAGPEADPVKRAQELAVQQAGIQAWNGVVTSVSRDWPGRVMFLRVASSLEVGGQYSAWLPGQSGAWSRARKVDNAGLCPTGAAALGSALLGQLTPVLSLPPPAPAWWSGSWTKDDRYNDPPGACPNDQPPR